MRTWFSFAKSYCHSISHSKPIIENLYSVWLKNRSRICFIYRIRFFEIFDKFDSYSWSSHYFTLNILILLAFVKWLICNKPFRLQLSLLWRITSLYYTISKFIMDVEEYNIKSWVASFWWICLEMYKKSSNQ